MRPTRSLNVCVCVCVSILMAMTAAKFTLRLHYCKQNASAHAFRNDNKAMTYLKGLPPYKTLRDTHTDTEAENEK